jgi:hypothetical protein
MYWRLSRSASLWLRVCGNFHGAPANGCACCVSFPCAWWLATVLSVRALHASSVTGVQPRRGKYGRCHRYRCRCHVRGRGLRFLHPLHRRLYRAANGQIEGGTGRHYPNVGLCGTVMGMQEQNTTHLEVPPAHCRAAPEYGVGLRQHHRAPHAAPGRMAQATRTYRPRGEVGKCGVTRRVDRSRFWGIHIPFTFLPFLQKGAVRNFQQRLENFSLSAPFFSRGLYCINPFRLDTPSCRSGRRARPALDVYRERQKGGGDAEKLGTLVARGAYPCRSAQTKPDKRAEPHKPPLNPCC